MSANLPQQDPGSAGGARMMTYHDIAREIAMRLRLPNPTIPAIVGADLGLTGSQAYITAQAEGGSVRAAWLPPHVVRVNHGAFIARQNPRRDAAWMVVMPNWTAGQQYGYEGARYGDYPDYRAAGDWEDDADGNWEA